ncbi:MAG TPA: winged helix-turn-helix transcriptional regulator, partial [Aggregatilineaceae bacterium]|nr:winged helix-turn-helix transcriptional regulator [Aggregatilineaceae bacterium]
MSSPITTPELMRQQNRAVILETIQERGPISRVDLARLLKLNPATVTRITRVLLEEDLICETGEGTTLGAGRKPTLLNFNHRARLLLGVHMGARGTTGVIADMAGAVLARRTILPGGTVSALVEELLSTDPSYTRRLVAGCLSASHPGLITDEMCRALHTELSIPIFAADDAELSARGEAEWGAARDQSFFALLYLGQHSRSVSYLDGYLRVGGLGFDAQGWPLAQQLSDQ